MTNAPPETPGAWFRARLARALSWLSMGVMYLSLKANPGDTALMERMTRSILLGNDPLEAMADEIEGFDADLPGPEDLFDPDDFDPFTQDLDDLDADEFGAGGPWGDAFDPDPDDGDADMGDE